MAGAGFASAQATARQAAVPQWRSDLIRLHVLANSDSDEDQALKRAVRDAVIAALEPTLAQAESLEEAEGAIRGQLGLMEKTAAAVLRSHGKDHAVRAEFGRFQFPTRQYGSVLLPAGEYSALRVVLGEGAGQNWWCVLFPPLCFADWTTGVVLEPLEPPAQTRPTSDRRLQVVRKGKRPVYLDERTVSEMPVRARFLLVDKVTAWIAR